MGWLRTLVCSAAALLFVSAVAQAADMPGYPPEPPPPLLPPPHRVVPIEDVGGWYLRGDLGYALGELQGAQSASPFPDPTSSALGDGFVGSVGAGYKSNWLRTDVTLDYNSPLKYTGTIVTPGDTTAKIEAVSALFNGYIDLGTWYRATPYIGAGAGVAQLHTTDYASNGSPPFTAGLSNTQWNFAWALMAGVGYAAGPNVMIDAGYRYVDFGDVKTASDSFGAMTFKNVYAHEFRIGIRWSFDDQPFPE